MTATCLGPVRSVSDSLCVKVSLRCSFISALSHYSPLTCSFFFIHSLRLAPSQTKPSVYSCSSIWGLGGFMTVFYLPMSTLGYLRKQVILKVAHNYFMIHGVSISTTTPKWGISYWLTACHAWIRLCSYGFHWMLSVTRNNDFGSALESWDLDKIDRRVLTRPRL